MSRDERRVEASPLFLEIKEGLLVSFEDVLHLRLCFLLEDRSMTRLKDLAIEVCKVVRRRSLVAARTSSSSLKRPCALS